MTNTERASADELDELPPWDDAETLDRLAAQLTAADTRTLAIYGLDSDKQTLVGLGPVERARRSREAAEKLEAAQTPDSQRMPQSEPPGPFIADGDDELPPFVRPRKHRGWAIGVPALLMLGAASLVLVRGGPPDPPPATKPSRAIVAQGPAAQLASEPATQVASGPAPTEMPAAATLGPAEGHAELSSAASAPVVSSESESESSASRPRGSQPLAHPPSGVAALPVKLAEMSSPVVVDRSGGTEGSVGTINVTSTPPANVVLDGRPLGKAPRIVRVPAGVHQLVFIHPLYGRRSLSVSVSPGATAGASVEF